MSYPGRHLTPEEHSGLSPETRETRRRALEVIRLMRERGLSLTAAMSEAETTRETALKYAGWALEQTPGGRWSVTPWDRIPRSLKFLTPDGAIALWVKDSRSASRVARYWAAVDRFLKTGDPTPLQPFTSASVQLNGRVYEFVTSPALLERLANAGQVSFPDLYVITS